MDSPKTANELRRLAKLHDEFLRLLEPNSGLSSIHVFEACVDLSDWFLARWDKDVRARQDFVYVSDAHYKRSGFYVDYDSLRGLDYDDLIENLIELGKIENQKNV